MELVDGIARDGCEPDRESNLLGEDFGSWLEETANFDGEFESIVNEFGGLGDDRKLNVSTPNNQFCEENSYNSSGLVKQEKIQTTLKQGKIQEQQQPKMMQQVGPQKQQQPPPLQQHQQQYYHMMQPQQQQQMQAYMQPIMQMVPYPGNMGQAQQPSYVYQMPMYYPQQQQQQQQQQQYPYMVPYMMPYMPQAVYAVPQQAQRPHQGSYVQQVEPRKVVTADGNRHVRTVVAAPPPVSEPIVPSENKTPAKPEIEKTSDMPRKTSKYRGVSWHKRDKVWLARAWLDGKVEHLGCFRSELMAALVVDFRYEGHRADSSLNFLRKEREKIIEQLKASGEFNVPLFVQNQLKRKHSTTVDEVSGPPFKNLKSN